MLSTIGSHGNVVEGMSGFDVIPSLPANIWEEIDGRRIHERLVGGLDSYGVLVRLRGSNPRRGVLAYVGMAPRQTAGVGSRVYCHLILVPIG